MRSGTTNISITTTYYLKNIELENTIERLEEEVNKQAKIIQWYEKENRHNQEIIIDLSKRIDKAIEYIKEKARNNCWVDQYESCDLIKILNAVK